MVTDWWSPSHQQSLVSSSRWQAAPQSHGHTYNHITRLMAPPGPGPSERLSTEIAFEGQSSTDAGSWSGFHQGSNCHRWRRLVGPYRTQGTPRRCKASQGCADGKSGRFNLHTCQHFSVDCPSYWHRAISHEETNPTINRHTKISMVVANGLVPVWHQAINNHHDDTWLSVHVRRPPV